MKASYLLFLMIPAYFSGFAQKVFSEGTILYNVSVISGKAEPGVADAFDGATLTVYMKGSEVRSDFKSILMTQSIIYSAKDSSAVKLNESGQQKYITYLNSSQWVQYNRKYDGIRFNYQSDSKTVAGYNCKKAVGTLKDGGQIVVYYTPDLVALAPGYEYEFKNLPGMPLEYEVTSGKIVVKYSASSIQFSAVNASRFDLPTSGYKILDYKQ